MQTQENSLHDLLQSKGLKAPLDLPENRQRFQESLAEANGVPPEEAYEWLAGLTGLLPFKADRPGISVQTETTFRDLATGQPLAGIEPWLPVGALGPLLIIGHYNPAETECWGVPSEFAIKVLIPQGYYGAYAGDLQDRLVQRPLQEKSPTAVTPPPQRPASPETVFRWLLKEYPYKEEERHKLGEVLETLSGVSAVNVINNKALPGGYGAALRHLCTGESCFNATLAPRQSAFPDALLEKHSVFPLYCGKNTIYLLSSQKEIFAFEDEWLASSSETRGFRVVLAEKDAITRVINRDRSAASGSEMAAISGELAESSAANVVEIDPNEVSRINPASINTTAEQALHWVLHRSITGRASDLHIEKYYNMARFRGRIDGELVTLFSAPEEMLPRYVSLIKNYSNMSQERQGAQDGRFSLRIGKRRVDCRVSAIPCRKDQQKITIRYLEKEGGVRRLSELNLSQRNLDLLNEAMSRDQGLILITGPTGSGKTTTLYALLNSVNSENLNIQTIEDPIEYEVEGLNQTQTDPVHDIDFAQGLRRLMRADPDVILIGECRDEETASAAVNAALTGHLVLTTLHANDCLRAVSRFISMGVPPYLLADSLALTQAQRLVRKLCGQCKRMVPVTKGERSLFAANKVPLPAKTTHLYEAEGCPDCRETGYNGRIALMELCPIDRELADLISVNAPQGEMRKIATARGLRTLYQEGLVQVMEGNTSLEEIKCLAYTGVAASEDESGSDSGSEENFDI
jgi:type II secretory ATPase GspE/PulE/Tfp pilus assembly ATPase PilB-like protein